VSKETKTTDGKDPFLLPTNAVGIYLRYNDLARKNKGERK
tara:strand:+ start:165 stop:284 length:120 start_codon:yes stop_codon:yes gene_type:complete